MKIYTFNAPSKTPIEFLWPLRPNDRGKSFEKLISETRWIEVDDLKDCDLAIYPRKAFHPESLVLDRSVWAAAKEAEMAENSLIIDAIARLNEFYNSCRGHPDWLVAPRASRRMSRGDRGNCVGGEECASLLRTLSDRSQPEI
jgi:hypothetical protein